MSTPSPTLGHVVHIDLTVPDADKVRDFYAQVCGWTFDAVSMGDYDDYMMMAKGTYPPRDEKHAHNAVGICHAKGSNASQPAQWILYIDIADMDKSLAACKKLGGKVVTEMRSYGKSKFCVVEDPAGAVIGLFEQVND